MMKKLISVFLALTLCVALAIPAFADPAEEVPMPEEAEVLPVEEIPAFTDPLEEEEPEEIEEITEPEREAEVPKDEGNTYLYQKDTNTNSINAISSQSSSHEGVCIMKDMWCEETYYKKESDQHRLWGKFKVYCSLGCGANGYIDRPIEEWENHSWIKGSLKGCQSNSGTTHTATYNYSCSVCGKTTTKTETESHSLSSRYTGNNYHQGTMHYFEYEHKCSQCGYTKTLQKSYSCPGPTGGGCITESAINKAEPPVEELDVTEPEEVTEPEVADIPEEVEMPEETEALEETVDTEDPTGLGETAVPDDGESVG